MALETGAQLSDLNTMFPLTLQRPLSMGWFPPLTLCLGAMTKMIH